MNSYVRYILIGLRPVCVTLRYVYLRLIYVLGGGGHQITHLWVLPLCGVFGDFGLKQLDCLLVLESLERLIPETRQAVEQSLVGADRHSARTHCARVGQIKR